MKATECVQRPLNMKLRIVFILSQMHESQTGDFILELEPNYSVTSCMLSSSCKKDAKMDQNEHKHAK